VKDKFNEGMVVSFGTIAAQGIVEGAEKYLRHAHSAGHIIVFAVVIAVWAGSKLIKGTK